MERGRDKSWIYYRIHNDAWWNFDFLKQNIIIYLIYLLIKVEIIDIMNNIDKYTISNNTNLKYSLRQKWKWLRWVVSFLEIIFKIIFNITSIVWVSLTSIKPSTDQ